MIVGVVPFLAVHTHSPLVGVAVGATVGEAVGAAVAYSRSRSMFCLFALVRPFTTGMLLELDPMLNVPEVDIRWSSLPVMVISFGVDPRPIVCDD